MLPGWPLLLLLQQAPAPQVMHSQVAAAATTMQASVLLVRGKLGDLHGHQGSGVVIAPHLVATNAHVVEGAHGLTVSQGATTWPVTSVRVDPGRDICLLTVPTLTAPPAQLAADLPEPGQPVLVVGYPGGHGPVASSGRLRGIWYHHDGRLLQSDALVLPGNSGGGLFNETGQLLGLTTLTFTSSPRLNFSVPVAWIQALANERVGDLSLRPNLGREYPSSDLLEQLAQDARNWPAWELAARQWVHDLPNDESAWLALGLALDRSARVAAERGEGASAKLLPEGIAAYRRSLALRKDAKTWNNLGVSLDLINHFDEAEVAFAEALSLEPSYALAWLNLGCARMNARRFKAAVEALRQGLALRPDEADAWVRLAYCQWMVGQKGMAVGTFQIALRYRPLAQELWLDFGLLLVELNRTTEARGVHERLVAMNPEVAARLQASLNRAQNLRTASTAAKHPH